MRLKVWRLSVSALLHVAKLSRVPGMMQAEGRLPHRGVWFSTLLVGQSADPKRCTVECLLRTLFAVLGLPLYWSCKCRPSFSGSSLLLGQHSAFEGMGLRHPTRPSGVMASFVGGLFQSS